MIFYHTRLNWRVHVTIDSYIAILVPEAVCDRLIALVLCNTEEVIQNQSCTFSMGMVLSNYVCMITHAGRLFNVYIPYVNICINIHHYYFIGSCDYDYYIIGQSLDISLHTSDLVPTSCVLQLIGPL